MNGIPRTERAAPRGRASLERVASRTAAPLLAFALALAAPLAAQAPGPLEGVVDDADPLALARLADRVGDGAVLAAIADEGAGGLARLRAVRAARFLGAPEAALAGLARLAHGRDPALAPAAAIAAYRIAERLSKADLEANETGAEVRAAAETLALLRDDETARPDLRRLAGYAVDALAALDREPGGEE